jgi:acyl-CoA synthetase (NDP forming)
VDIRNLLRPKSVAIVGASEKPGFGGATTRNLINSGWSDDRLFLVNPNRSEILGRRCYKSISDIPEAADLVIVATPKKTVNGILEEAAARGCKAAVVYASGYSETGQAGKIAEEELRNIALKYNMTLCGPNCAGFVNNIDKVSAFGLPLYNPQRGNIGLIAQSGQVCVQLLNVDYMKYSYAISSGNNAVLDLVDYLDFLVEDEETKVIAVYLEGVKNPARFTEVLARAARKRKPIIVLKTGISEKSQKVATAHTGSLTGSDSAYSALFKKYGVIRVYDMEELLTTSLLFSTLAKMPEKPSLAMINLSGGETAISADLAHLKEILMPDFTPGTLQKLREILPDYATPNNPLDMTATLAYDPGRYREVLRTTIGDPNIGMLAVGLNIPKRITPQNEAMQMGLCSGIVDVARQPESKPIVILPSLAGERYSELRRRYEEAHVPILSCPAYGFSAIKHLIDFTRYKPESKTLNIAVPSKVNTGKEETVRILSEHESKELLREFGIPVPQEYVVRSGLELVEKAHEIGYPVVLKIDSKDIPHKTEVGGVKLNINNDDELLTAYDEILANVHRNKPEARINGVLLQPMLPPGLEVIIGVNTDKQFGPLVLIGLGGVFVEVFKDIAVYAVPLNRAEAVEMINSLKAAPLFHGYRGGEVLDVDALVDTIISVGRLAEAYRDTIRELDINPMFVYEKGKGIGVADALVVLNERR